MTTNEARIAAARCLVAAPLIITLADNQRNRNIRALMRAEWEHQGELTISDAVLHPYVLHLRLSKVPKGYRLNIAIPAGYEKSLRANFPIFREAAQAFWTELRARDLSDLPARLCETETALYWTADDEYWLGIFGYFTDGSGHKYITDGCK
jgi:hypothetical protein